MLKIEFTVKAVDDLTDIWNYTYKTWSEDQADKYYNMLIGKCRQLAETPTIGRHYYQVAVGILGYKAGSHIIFYSIVESSKILIIRILHKKMDFANRLID